MNVRDLGTEEKRRGWRGALYRAGALVLLISLRYRGRRPDGTILWWILQSSPNFVICGTLRLRALVWAAGRLGTGSGTA